MNGYAMPRYLDTADDHLSFALSRDDLIDEDAETESGLEPVAGFRVRIDPRAATAELAPALPARRQRTLTASSASQPAMAPTMRSHSSSYRRLRRQPTGMASSLTIAIVIGCLVGAVMYLTCHRTYPAMFSATTTAAGTAKAGVLSRAE